MWVIVLLLLPLSIIVNGLLLKMFWGWFIVPLGIAPIGVAHALGIALIVGMLTHQHSHSDNNDKTAARLIGRMIMYPIIYLIFGSIYYAFMV